MQLRAVPDDCEACRALGAEVCPECSAILLERGPDPCPGSPGAALSPARTDLTLREASVVLAHVARFAPEAYSAALGYADEYLGRRT